MISNNKLISIIIPTYNNAKGIISCVESALAQTYGNYEVIIVNDGSTDSTSEVLKNQFNDNKKVIIHNQENQGIFGSRNKGIVLSKGDYICFMDHDDYMEKRALEIAYKNIMEHKADVCIFGHDRVDTSDGHVIYRVCERTSRFYTSTELFEKTINSNKGYVWNKLIKKEFVIPFYDGIRLGEDTLFSYYLALKFPRVYYLNEILYHYCDSKVSVLRSLKNNEKNNVTDLLRVIEIMESDLKTRKDVPKEFYKTLFIYKFSTLPFVIRIARLSGASIDKLKLKEYRKFLRKNFFKFFFMTKTTVRNKIRTLFYL